MLDIEIPMDAEVSSEDGPYGRPICVIVDPIREKVTHLVVEENDFPQTQRLVPINLIHVTASKQIGLECSSDQLKKMDAFVETEFVPSNPELTWMMIWPYVEPTAGYFTVEHEHMPDGEIAIRRGAHVHATDGFIGRVDELMIDRNSGKITHLVLREGLFRWKRDISIPVSKIERMDQNTVYLKLSKREVDALPEIPIRRFNR